MMDRGKRRILAIGAVGGMPTVLVLFCIGYYLFGYDGPRSTFTAVVGDGEFVMDADGRWTIVKKDEIRHSAFFLAVWLGKVKEVRVSKKGTSLSLDRAEAWEKAYVWRRSLPKNWNDRFQGGY